VQRKRKNKLARLETSTKISKIAQAKTVKQAAVKSFDAVCVQASVSLKTSDRCWVFLLAEIFRLFVRELA